MPHLTVLVSESQLSGREPDLIASLTDAVVGVYGDWARPMVVVCLIGIPEGRWAVGGTVSQAAPTVQFSTRASALERADGIDTARRLVSAVTEGIVAVFGEDVRASVTVELLAESADRLGVGGTLISDSNSEAPSEITGRR